MSRFNNWCKSLSYKLHRLQKYTLHKSPEYILLLFFKNIIFIYNNVNWILFKKSKQRIISKKAPERYEGFSEEEKYQKCKYARERDRNLPEDVKQRFTEYRKNYSRMEKRLMITEHWIK